MNTISRAGWVSVLLIFSAGWLSAQKSTQNEDLVKADRQFALYAYNLAMQTYQQVLKDDPRNSHALARIGDCYFQLNTPEKSLEWYQKAIRQYNMESDVHLRYGMALMQNKDYDGAKSQFLAYAEYNDAVGNHYANVSEYAALNAKKETVWQVKNEPLNTAYADFCPTFLNSRVVYSSARTDVTAKAKSSDSPSGAQNYLLVSQRNPESGLLQKPQILRSELQNARNEGPASFSANGRRVAFCRNNFINGTRQIAESGINMSLYTGDVDDNGRWENIKAFPYNGSNYATGFPALSPDGSTLIFASTQPGGLGGWDIYVSNYQDGTWTTPRNLGSPLNTPGNEVTPFFDGKSLFFSSDWHSGLGGLDVFRAELGAEAVNNIYHLGSGVNSERDDYGFIYNSSDNIGYVTSTRPGGRGNEDIWMLTKKWDDEAALAAASLKAKTPYSPSEYNDYANPSGEKSGSNALHLLITDERGNELSGAEVDLTDCYGTKGYTDFNGQFDFEALTKIISCQVNISKNGFRNEAITLNNFGQQNIRIALTPESRQRFNGRVYDARSGAAVRGVLVQVQFQDGTQPVETITDEDGAYTLFMDAGASYMVNYNKYGYVNQIVKTYLGYDMIKIPNVLLEQLVENRSVADNTVDTKPVVYSNDAQPIKTIFRKTDPPPPVTVPVVPLTGYSIQLGAMPNEPSNHKLGTYESLTRLGNLYVKQEASLFKIRLGIFSTKTEANEILKQVVATKIQKDAFIIAEYGADESLIVQAQPVQPTVYNSPEPIPALASKGEGPDVLFALQLGSFASDKSIVISDYSNLRGMGNLYSNTENSFTQVRLGIWDTYFLAEDAQKEAVRRGFPKAFIVTEKGGDTDIQEFIVSNTYNTETKPLNVLNNKGAEGPRPQVYSTVPDNSPYFIRIAALSNPDRFDGSSLADLGQIEKRPAESSPGMTIILIAGFDTLDDANTSLIQVKRRGYQDAYVLKDEGGSLVRQ